MSSYTPQTNLSIERFRLNGMMLLGVATVCIFFLLTVQAWIALMQRPRYGEKIANHRRVLLFYVFITFALGTISFGMNARYTEMIWIDLRDAPGGPLALIEDYMSYRINFIALATGHIQEWFMQALLLHRCFVIWNWSRWVMVPMITLYVAMIACSIFVLVEASTGITFYNIIIELAYLWRMKKVIAQYDSRSYNTIALMVVESAVLYTVFAIVFIVAFATYSNGLTTLCFLSIGKIQGIAQLFIIIRVARGRAVTHEWSTRTPAMPTAIAFSGTVSDLAEMTDNEQIPEQDIVRVYADSEKTTDVIVCTAA
ncbi:hypothetical protein BDR07DRAFT_1424338 [Suillus spraguei]|nr:hypothetical protein BDR07DRAFT_1424338 [Suillus spraguei]